MTSTIVRNLLRVAVARRRKDPTRRFLLYVLLPLWTAAGVADYLYHRRTRIETTSGVRESTFHLAMMLEAGPPILSGLFLEINAGVLLGMMAAFLAHQGTAMWDVWYTADKRKTPEGEQHIHAFLEMLPFCAVAIAACTHWEQLQALFGAGPENARFDVRFLRPPQPARYVVPLIAASGALNFGVHLEEWWRCYQAERRGVQGADTPECVRELYG
jgi:hypothetical protein